VDYEIVSNRGKESAENLKVKWPQARRPRHPAGLRRRRLKVAGRQPSETTTPEQLAWEIEVNRCSLCFPKRNQLYANMPKPVKVTRKRKRGRPATGRDPV